MASSLIIDINIEDNIDNQFVKMGSEDLKPGIYIVTLELGKFFKAQKLFIIR